MARVSIIMPVYNAEKFISEAIESVLAQTYPDFELLLVNDRSTDRSREICGKYAKKDNRIVLLENNSDAHGPGPTRNLGLEHAAGDYVYFIDADDWVEPDLLEITVALAEETGADIVPFGFIIEDGGTQIKKRCSPCGTYAFDNLKDAANEIIRGTWSECHELTRRDVLRDVRHNHYKTGEDICFQMDLMCRVKRVCAVEREFYHYRVVEGSISHAGKWNPLFAEISAEIWNKEHAFLAYCGLGEDTQTVKNSAIERYTGCIYQLCQRDCSLSLGEKCRELKRIGEAMEIGRFKRGFDCSPYPGLKKIVKLLVKYNLESLMLLAGTVFLRIFQKSKG